MTIEIASRWLTACAAILMVAMVASCGGSSQTARCARWRAHALQNDRRAWANAQRQAHGVFASLPNDDPNAERNLALAIYHVAADQAFVADTNSSKWRTFTKSCPMPHLRVGT